METKPNSEYASNIIQVSICLFQIKIIVAYAFWENWEFVMETKPNAECANDNIQVSFCLFQFKIITTYLFLESESLLWKLCITLNLLAIM